MMELPAQLRPQHREKQAVWDAVSERATDWWPTASEDLGHRLMPSKEKGFSTRAESSNSWHHWVSVLWGHFVISSQTLAQWTCWLCALWSWRLWGGGGGGEEWGRVNYAVGSFILVFWDGEAWVFLFVCLFFAVLDCACWAKQAWRLKLIHLKTKLEFCIFFRLLCSNCVFNACSFFSLGHRIEVDVDSKLYFSCNYFGMMHISNVCYTCTEYWCWLLFFLKEKMAWKTFF